MTESLAELAAAGVRKVGIYGAGLHTERLADVLAASPVNVAAVLDDDSRRAGQLCAGLQVIPPGSARELGIEAVVISSDRYEAQIFARCQPLAEQGIAIHRLYAEGAPPTHYEAGWDEYARYWSPDSQRLVWDVGKATLVSDPDQSDKRHPGDEWAGADAAVRQMIEPVLPADAVVLEIGPGSGRITQRVLPLCRELHAVEISSEMIEALHRRIGHAANLHVWKISDVDLSMFHDATFDAAYSIGVFVHLQMEDIYRYLRELRRVLKPGACFVIEAVCDMEGPAQWHRFLNKVADFDAGRREDPRRFHFISRQTLALFCAHLGWQMEIDANGALRFRSVSPAGNQKRISAAGRPGPAAQAARPKG